MEKETLEEYESVLEEIAHFLIINSEATDSNGLNGKMPLLYFFFMYAKKFEKQNYSDLAFELLEEALSEELMKIQTQKNHELSFNLATFQMGWSIQQFSTMHFFESNELNEILAPFDKMGLDETELLVKSKPLVENIRKYAFLYSYLNERIEALKNDDTKGFISKEYASNLIKKLYKCLTQFSIKNKHIKILLESLFDKHRNFDTTDWVIDRQALITICDKSMKKNDLDTMLLLKCCFPGIGKTWHEKTNLIDLKVISKVNNAMKMSYENHDIFDHLIVPKIAIYGSILLLESTSINPSLLAHSLVNAYHEKQSM